MAHTVLVTGGLGFIGSHFVRLLLRERPGLRVVNLDKVTYAGNPDNLASVASDPRYRFVRGDIADREFVDHLFVQERPEIVLNFAAESHVDRSILDARPFLQTNTQGVQVLLEAARSHLVARFLQVSTDEVYGDIPSDQASAGEDAPLRPSSPYSATKAAGDLLCSSYARTYRLPVLIARSSNNYGPNQFPEKLVPLTIRNALNGKPLPVYGDGKQVRDWIYVEDNVKAILLVMDRGQVGRVYNIATGYSRENETVVREICDLIGEETGFDRQELLGRITRVKDRPGHDRRYASSTARIRGELGWSPNFQFREGLRRTIQWYISNTAWLERVTSGAYHQYYDQVYTHSWGQEPA
jgi:dTDP-glucose 4,6-dehydratase